MHDDLWNLLLQNGVTVINIIKEALGRCTSHDANRPILFRIYLRHWGRNSNEWLWP